MKTYSRVYAAVHLDYIEENAKAIRSLAGGKKVIGVVKADGYGHGAVPVAKAIRPYVDAFAVATAEEGVQLRRHGLSEPVIVLGRVPEPCFETVLEYGLQPAVFELHQAESLSQLAVSQKKRAKIQLAVDTGMGRIGWRPDAEAADEALAASRLPGIEIKGIFTHFARADEKDKGFTMLQLERFKGFLSLLRERGLKDLPAHCANSAGIMDLDGGGMDAVRAGIILYGLYPSGEVRMDRLSLKPAMELKSFISYIKDVEPGASISYGGTFTASAPMRVATIPVGYGDGYPRNLSGRGCVLIRGRRAPILGRVCMDQFMADVTDIPEAREEDMVTLIGRDGGEVLSMEEVAASCGGFHYEIPCVLGKRVPRVYLSGDRIVGQKDYFEDMYLDFT